jgi:hypothetical protein
MITCNIFLVENSSNCDCLTCKLSILANELSCVSFLALKYVI